MPCILQIDFPFNGPWGDDMAAALGGLAQSIAQEPGLLWKIWTEDAASGVAGGIYAFSDRASAEAYLAMHRKRLQEFGVSQLNVKILGVNAALSRINKAPL